MSGRLVWVLVLSAVSVGAESARAPVLVELFISEGCSSCPPADALLEQLDRQQAVPEAQVIVLSEHVDYWNHLGWADPWSSRAFSNRQELYARLFGTSGPYTPQMVVDGAAEFVGSDGRAAIAAIRAAAKRPKLPMRVTATDGKTVRVEVDAVPDGKNRKGVVWLAFAEDGGTSNVLRGENRGRTLHHVAIARELRQVASFAERAGYAGELPLPAGAAADGRRVVAFVQDADTGKVWGAARMSIPASGRLVP
jgi:hypothetical protein